MKLLVQKVQIHNRSKCGKHLRTTARNVTPLRGELSYRLSQSYRHLVESSCSPKRLIINVSSLLFSNNNKGHWGKSVFINNH